MKSGTGGENAKRFAEKQMHRMLKLVAREVGKSWNYAGHKGKDEELEQDAVEKGGVSE